MRYSVIAARNLGGVAESDEDVGLIFRLARIIESRRERAFPAVKRRITVGGTL